MFWLAVLFHVRHCYIMTKHQPCFRIYAVNVLHHGYYSTATRKWQKGRLKVFLPTKSRRKKNYTTLLRCSYKLPLSLLSLVQFWLSAFTVVKTFIPLNYFIKLLICTHMPHQHTFSKTLRFPTCTDRLQVNQEWHQD